ncbi:acetyl-coenzyme A transporter 1 [Culex quinquefasciatus]|uniref:Acetyl-coenzyme A transporter 1 n=1 Tax=Culex quinquefasciatus TaxID=7176 RepID=B0XFL9_CULQU|nr:acetyl-coenzyme A transporter 1 [Culex quinquefasciatus]|eukprot:XP_001868441.1 acetyl-coenzyme A transporter 1 [Culex quinquefasciatus]
MEFEFDNSPEMVFWAKMRPEVEVVQGRLWKVLDDNPNLATDSAGRKIPESTNPQMIVTGPTPAKNRTSDGCLKAARGERAAAGHSNRAGGGHPDNVAESRRQLQKQVRVGGWAAGASPGSSRPLIGLFMLILSLRVNRWLENSEGNDVASHVAPNIPILTVIFIVMDFLAATQDIAVGADDAEALQYRSRVHLQQRLANARYFLGYVAFMALESAEFCISYLRSEPVDECLVTLPGFLWFWGLVFLVTTTLIALLVVHLNPLQIILPLVFSKGWPYQIAPTLFAAAVVWFTPAMIYDHHVPYHYYQILLTNYGLYQIALYSMFVAKLAHHRGAVDGRRADVAATAGEQRKEEPPTAGNQWQQGSGRSRSTRLRLGLECCCSTSRWCCMKSRSRWRRKTQNTSKFLRLTNRTELAVSMIRRQMAQAALDQAIPPVPPVRPQHDQIQVQPQFDRVPNCNFRRVPRSRRSLHPVTQAQPGGHPAAEANQSNYQRHDHHDTGTANRRGGTFDRRAQTVRRGYHLIVVLFADVAVAGLITGTSSLASKQAKLLEDPRMVQQNVNVTFSEILSNEIVHYQIAGEEKSQTKT